MAARKKPSSAEPERPLGKRAGAKSVEPEVTEPKTVKRRAVKPKAVEVEAVQPLAVDAAALSAMMAQMQALVEEVAALRSEVGGGVREGKSEEAPGGDVVSEGGRESLVGGVEEEGLDEEFEIEEVTAEEVLALREGMEQAWSEVEEGEAEVVALEETGSSDVVGVARVTSEIDLHEMTDEALATLLEEASQIPVDDVWAEEVVEETEEGEATIEVVMPDGEDLTNESLAALLAAAEAAGSEVRSEEAVEGDEDELQAHVGEILGQAEVFSESQALEETPVEAVEDDGGALSADEIAALFVQAEGSSAEVTATDTVAGDSLENGSPDEGGGNLSDDEIAALLAEADTRSEAVSSLEAPVVDAGTDLEAEGDGWDDFAGEEHLPSEEELLAMVRGEIEAQDAAREEAALAEEFAHTVQNSGVQSASSKEDEEEGVLSADEIAAMLAEPDPEGAIPESSEMMDDEEIARLLMEAQSQEVEGIDQGTSFHDAPMEEETEPEPVLTLEEGGVTEASAVQETVSVSGGPDLGAVKAVPAHLAVRALAVPVRFADGKLVLKVAEPMDQAALDRISKATGFGLVTVGAPIDEVVGLIREVYAEVRDDHARMTLMQSQSAKPGLWDTVKSVLRRIA